MYAGWLNRPAQTAALFLAAILFAIVGPPRLAGAAEGQKGSGGTTAARPSGDKTTGQSTTQFGSLKSDRVEVRQGPGSEHPVLWVYKRAGTPVELLAEADTWRRVRDVEGAEGWVQAPYISNRRTAIVRPRREKSSEPQSEVALRRDDSESAATVVLVEAGVIADIRSCDGRWCLVSVGEFRGWVEQAKLWGLAVGEVIR